MKRNSQKTEAAPRGAALSTAAPEWPGRLSGSGFLDETGIIVSRPAKRKAAGRVPRLGGGKAVSTQMESSGGRKPGLEGPLSGESGGAAPPGLRRRPMRRDDLPAVVASERRSYTLPWSEDTFRHELGKVPNSHLLVTEGPAEGDDGRGRIILGYACWWEVVDECHITNVTVSPEARRRGVGRFLVEGILDDARRRGVVRATLEVRVGNAAAAGLYEKCGFTSVAMRRRYYPDNGEDALVMWKEKI